MIGIEAKGSTEMAGGTAEDDQPYIADYGECMDMGGEVAPSLTIESVAAASDGRSQPLRQRSAYRLAAWA
jgi:hypothetical protein